MTDAKRFAVSRRGAGRPLAAAKRFHRSVGVNLTMRCPLECAHCSVDSGPWRTETVDAGLLSTRVDEIGRDGRIRLVMVSGGEPFSAREVLRKVLDAAAPWGITVFVLTSGIWAKGREAAERTLDAFPTLRYLGFSLDEYHEPFVPIADVRTGVVAALDRGLLVDLTIRVWDVAGDPFLDRVADAFGDELLSRVGIDLERIVSVGRALALPRAPEPERPGFPEGACDSAHQPVIDTDGTVVACCNVSLARRTPPLVLGSLRDLGLPAITRAAEEDVLRHAIRVFGPKYLADLVVEKGEGARLKGRYPADICALCHDVLRQPELVSLLREELARPERRTEVALGRLLRFGEEDPALAPAGAAT